MCHLLVLSMPHKDRREEGMRGTLEIWGRSGEIQNQRNPVVQLGTWK